MAAKRQQKPPQKRPPTSAPPTRPVPAASTRPVLTAAPRLPWTSHLAALLTIPALALVLYWPSLDGPFVYDDPNAISQSTLIRRLTPLSTFFTLSSRPLSDYSFAINYKIGGLRPRSYHVTNLLLHIVNGLLLYGLAARALAQPVLARYHGARAGIAWAAAALFVAHPLASETVAYVSSRSEVLAASWYLLAVLSYAIAATTRAPAARRLHALLLPVWVTAAVLSKEIAFTVPAALLLYDWLFIAAGDRRRTVSRWRLIGLALLPLLAGGLFLVVRASGSGASLGEYGATAGLGFDRFSGTEYLMTQFGVILYYLRLVVLPVEQTFDYDWPLAHSPLAPAVLLPFVILAAIVWLAWRWRRAQPLFTFAIGWTLLILAPTSSVVPIADLAVERRMYLPLAGLMLLAAASLFDLASIVAPRLRTRPTWALPVLVAVLLVPLGWLTHGRAALWGDPIALHEDGVAKAPANPRVRLNLGVTYLNLRQQDKALAVLDEAKRLYDRHESVHAFPRIGAFIQYNLGAVLYSHQQYDRAAVELQRSLEIGGRYLALRPMAHMLLGRIDGINDDWAGAAAHMQEALRYQESVNWRLDLIEMYKHAGNAPAALASFTEVARRYPNDPRVQELRAKAVAADAAKRERAAQKKPE